MISLSTAPISPMRFEVELTLAGKRFKYAISFEWPAEVPRGTYPGRKPVG